MKTFKSIFALALAITFILTGCAREAYTPPVLPTNTKGTCTPSPTDQDGDCILDPQEFQNNEETKEVACKLDDGTTLYIDCLTAPDCNCNLIPDGEEQEMTENCGWGCVAGNARTYAMIGIGLLVGYAGYSYLAHRWPFGEDEDKLDTVGNEIDYVELIETADRIDWDQSFVKYDEENALIQSYIAGKCKSLITNETFWCHLEMQYGIDNLRTPDNNKFSPDPYRDNLGYSFDLKKSKIHGAELHFIKVTDTRENKSVYLKDPNWVGLPAKDKDGSTRVPFELKSKFNQSADIWAFHNLELGDTNTVCYQLHPYSKYNSANLALFSNSNSISYYWKKIACN